MDILPLGIFGAYEVITKTFRDDRGVFLESFRNDLLNQTIGHEFELKQANTSVSHKGVLRGIHFADVPNGQAKYVTVPSGGILDFIVDLRQGSPTFGKTASLEINSVKRNAAYLAEGLGHAFLSLEDNTVVNYFVSDVYRPDREHGINPLDPDICLEIPEEFLPLVISDKDLHAPSLKDLVENNSLPSWEAVSLYYKQLNGESE